MIWFVCYDYNEPCCGKERGCESAAATTEDNQHTGDKISNITSCLSI